MTTSDRDRARRDLLRRERTMRPHRIAVPPPNPRADEAFARLIEALRPAPPRPA
jgi:hypothetical protein